MHHMIAACLVGLGVGLLSGHIDWDRAKASRESLATVIVGLGAIGGGAIAAFNSDRVPWHQERDEGK